MPITITPQIVTLNTQVTAAPQPSTLQQSAAIISEGATTLASGTYLYCATLAAVETVFVTPSAGNQAELLNMATTFFAQGNAVGLYILELGVMASGTAGVQALTTWLTDNPRVFYSFLVPASWDSSQAGKEVASVVITNGGTGYTTAPTVTFTPPTTGTTATGTANVANGIVISVTITNPGNGYTSPPTVTFSAPTSGTTATGTADMVAPLTTLANSYASPSGMTYFFVMTTTATISDYAGIKSVITAVPAPAAASTEFTAATLLYQWSVQAPSAVAPASPMAYRQIYGCTPWPVTGQASAIQTILSAYGNIAYSGVEGGLTGTYIFKGTTSDGTQAMFWYAVDWFQIQIQRAMAAAIINGSNSIPPIVYNQQGINTLRTVGQGVADTSISFGLNLTATLTAQPFGSYTTQNPANAAAGIYGGFAATVDPQLGFLGIVFNIDAVQFAA